MGKRKKKKQRQKQKKQWLNIPTFTNKKDKKEKQKKHQHNHVNQSVSNNYVDMYYCIKCEKFLAHPVHENKNWNSCPDCREVKGFSFAQRTYLRR